MREDREQYIKTMSEFVMKGCADRHGLMVGMNASHPQNLTEFASEAISIGVDLITCSTLNVLANCTDRELLRKQMFDEIFSRIQQQVTATDIDKKIQELKDNEESHSRTCQH